MDDYQSYLRENWGFSALKSDITHNCRIKQYPDGSADICIASADIFRQSGWEQRGRDRAADRHRTSCGESDIDRSKRRARAAVYDLALSSDFKYFVTLTLDAQRIDRYDIDGITKRMNNWLDNAVRRKGLAYVLVPELHSDGAVHYHGFFNGALAVVDSGTLLLSGGKPRKPRSSAQRARWLDEGGRIVYNLPGWGFGFSTAIELAGDRRRAVNYVCKYITKGEQKVGGRWYYSGGDLGKPEVTFCTVSFDEFSCVNGAVPFSVEGVNCRFIKLTVDGGAVGE